MGLGTKIADSIRLKKPRWLSKQALCVMEVMTHSLPFRLAEILTKLRRLPTLLSVDSSHTWREREHVRTHYPLTGIHWNLGDLPA